MSEYEHQKHLDETGFWGKRGAGCLVFSRKTKRFLFAFRSAAVLEPNTWGMWGGAIDAGEKPEQSVLRELKEESGFQKKPVAVQLLDVFKAPGNVFTYYNFVVVVDDEFPVRLNWESSGARWVTLNNWPTPLHPKVREFLSKPAVKSELRALVEDAETASPYRPGNWPDWLKSKSDEGIKKYFEENPGSEYNPNKKKVQKPDNERTEPKKKIPEAVVDYANEKFGDRVAPNGRLVSQNFADWFGDSKAVDDSGKPVVMYHGSDARISEFKLGHKGTRQVMFHQTETEAHGFFFTQDKEDAGEYGPNVHAVYLSIQNPWIDPSNYVTSSKDSQEQKDLASKKYAELEHIMEPLMYADSDDEDAQKYIDVDGGVSRMEVDEDENWIDKVFVDGMIEWTWLDNKEFVSRLKEAGYDSVKVYEPNDNSGFSWFVLNPSSIKSVDNDGDFSMDDNKITASTMNRPSNWPDWLKSKSNEGIKKYFEENPGSEYNPIRKKKKATAPDTENKVKVTETPEFKTWFGQSKAVNEDGSPKVLFHGTSADIEEFKEKDLKGQSNKFLDIGIHFGSEDTANHYSGMYGVGRLKGLSDGHKEVDAPNVMPVYLRAENPAVIGHNQIPADVLESANELANEVGISRRAKSRVLSEVDPISYLTEIQRRAGKQAVQDIFTELGYDSIKYEWTLSDNQDGDRWSWLVFNPNQIKSATGNSGKFSMEDNKITASTLEEAAASDVVFHYGKAADILRTNEFRLSSQDDKQAEEEFGDKKRPFYLSTARNIKSRFIGGGNGVFEIDGTKLNQKFKTRPMDYWSSLESQFGRDPYNAAKGGEQEDRVYNTDDTIKDADKYIKALHVYKVNGEVPQRLKSAIFMARKRGIPVYLYEDEKFMGYKKKAVPVTKNDMEAPKRIGNFKKESYGNSSQYVPMIYETFKAVLDGKELTKSQRYIMRHYNDRDFMNAVRVDIQNANTDKSDNTLRALRKIRNLAKAHGHTSWAGLAKQVFLHANQNAIRYEYPDRPEVPFEDDEELLNMPVKQDDWTDEQINEWYDKKDALRDAGAKYGFEKQNDFAEKQQRRRDDAVEKDWFVRMSKQRQDAYLKKHPSSTVTENMKKRNGKWVIAKKKETAAAPLKLSQELIGLVASEMMTLFLSMLPEEAESEVDHFLKKYRLRKPKNFDNSIAEGKVRIPVSMFGPYAPRMKKMLGVNSIDLKLVVKDSGPRSAFFEMSTNTIGVNSRAELDAIRRKVDGTSPSRTPLRTTLEAEFTQIIEYMNHELQHLVQKYLHKAQIKRAADYSMELDDPYLASTIELGPLTTSTIHDTKKDFTLHMKTFERFPKDNAGNIRWMANNMDRFVNEQIKIWLDPKYGRLAYRRGVRPDQDDPYNYVKSKFLDAVKRVRPKAYRTVAKEFAKAMRPWMLDYLKRTILTLARNIEQAYTEEDIEIQPLSPVMFAPVTNERMKEIVEKDSLIFEFIEDPNSPKPWGIEVYSMRQDTPNAPFVLVLDGRALEGKFKVDCESRKDCVKKTLLSNVPELGDVQDYLIGIEAVYVDADSAALGAATNFTQAYEIPLRYFASTQDVHDNAKISGPDLLDVSDDYVYTTAESLQDWYDFAMQIPEYFKNRSSGQTLFDFLMTRIPSNPKVPYADKARQEIVNHLLMDFEHAKEESTPADIEMLRKFKQFMKYSEAGTVGDFVEKVAKDIYKARNKAWAERRYDDKVEVSSVLENVSKRLDSYEKEKPR